MVAAVTLLAAGWLLAGPAAGILLGAVGPAAVGPVLAARRRRWRRALGEGVPGVARALADALAGGHSIRGALEVLGGRGQRGSIVARRGGDRTAGLPGPSARSGGPSRTASRSACRPRWSDRPA